MRIAYGFMREILIKFGPFLKSEEAKEQESGGQYEKIDGKAAHLAGNGNAHREPQCKITGDSRTQRSCGEGLPGNG